MAAEASLTQRIRDGLLLDAYGGLLTEKQRDACEMILLQDFSLSETATALGVSRQGVHELVSRAREHMEETERQLGILEKERVREEMARLLESRREELPEDFYNEFVRLLGI